MKTSCSDAARFAFSSMEVLGANRNCVRMLLDDGTGRMNGVYFGDAGQFISYLKEKYPEGCREADARRRK